MLKEDRIVKLMAKCDNEVVKGQKPVAESLEEVTSLFFKSKVNNYSFIGVLCDAVEQGVFGVKEKNTYMNNWVGRLLQPRLIKQAPKATCRISCHIATGFVDFGGLLFHPGRHIS